MAESALAGKSLPPDITRVVTILRTSNSGK